ncbi:MAG: Do family serine endopeptidase [Spirochaetota bacterium]
MNSRTPLHSRKFFMINLVLVGLIIGFSMSMVVFSCSTRIQPGGAALAQRTGEDVDIQIEGLQSSFRQVAQAVMPTVVKLNVEELRSQQRPQGDNPFFDFFFGDTDDEDTPIPTQGLGSGVLVRQEGSTYYVLTNDHVVAEADSIEVVLDDENSYEATLVGTDQRKDLALVSFEEPDRELPLARFGNSDELAVGDWVLAVGSPFGFQSTVTAGIVSALERRGGPQGNINDFIQTDAAINQGNSGGPLINLRGEVVGINTWITSQTGVSAGLGFSIPINNASRAIEDFIERGSIQYGWLGVSIRDVSREDAGELGLENRQGALVHHVFVGSPAEGSGLQPGDFIRTVNGTEVYDADELILEVGDLPVGEVARFELIRQGEDRVVDVTIEEREAERTIQQQNAQLWPGLSVFPLTDDIREELELQRRTEGVIVTTVESQTPAANAGLRAGDVIVSLSGRSVANIREFYRVLNDDPGSDLEVEYLREGESTTTTLEYP